MALKPSQIHGAHDGGNYIPFWEGSFEKQGYTYTLIVPLSDPSGDVARRALSTMVEAPDEGYSHELSRGVPMRTFTKEA